MSIPSPGDHKQNGYQNRTGQYQKQYSSNHSNKYPTQKNLVFQNSRSTYSLSSKENYIISIEIKKLLKKLVIVYITPDEGEFISGIFARDKKGGNKRMILNLKKFNKNRFKNSAIFLYFKFFTF